MAKAIVALYDNFTTAETVARALVESGFAREDISLMANDPSGERGAAAGAGPESGNGRTTDDENGSGTMTGAAIGSAVGGVGGLLVGLGALAIPGMGPVIAAGPLAAALIG